MAKFKKRSPNYSINKIIKNSKSVIDTYIWDNPGAMNVVCSFDVGYCSMDQIGFIEYGDRFLRSGRWVNRNKTKWTPFNCCRAAIDVNEPALHKKHLYSLFYKGTNIGYTDKEQVAILFVATIQ